MERGILGFKKDPKKKILFCSNFEDWPSDDSSDSTYSPTGNQIIKPQTKNSEKRKHKKKKTRKKFRALEDDDEVNNVEPYQNMGQSKPIRPKKEKKRKPEVKLKFEANKTNITRFKIIKYHPESEKEPEEKPEGPWGTALPPEILLKIFQSIVRFEGVIPILPRVAKVCSSWRNVASHPSLWENVDLSSKARKIENHLIWLCENRLSRVQYINLSGWDSAITHRGIKAISERCSHLARINLTGCKKITAKDIQVLADSCPRLRALDLSQISRASSADSPVSANCIKYLMNKCGSNMTHFWLANNMVRGIPAIINSISDSCHNLRLLDLSNIQTMCRDVISISIEKIQRGCTRLQVFRIANAMARLANVPLSEQAGSPGFPELEELSIAVKNDRFDAGLNDNAVERILKASQKLKLLDVRHCNRISASSLVRIPTWDLEHIFLSQCSAANDAELELMMKKWKHSLIEVDLSWNSNADSAIDAAVSALATDSGLSKLQRLDLCGSSVSLDPVKNVLMKCHKLKVINLSSCRGLPRGMKRLYQEEELESLKTHLESTQFTQFDDIT